MRLKNRPAWAGITTKPAARSPPGKPTPARLGTSSATDATLPPEVRASFKSIAEHVELQARLVDDLLDLNRVARGKVVIKAQPLDLHAVLEDAFTTVGEDIRAAGITVDRRFQARAHLVQGDPVRLRQVFWNVLRNAVKFTPAGGRIIVSTENPGEPPVIAVRIRDTGIGLRPDELARIFNPFVQGRHTEDDGPRAYGGLGLGLAISRMLVESHGGSIHAESAGPDRGTTVVIRLPLQGVKASEALLWTREDEGVPSRPTFDPDRFAVVRILLVEDHEPTRRAMASLLTRRGFEVVAAGSVGQATTLGRRQTFDLLISDLGLPDGDGCSLMERMRRQHPALRGIAISGYGMAEDLRRSEAAGFDNHLTKPVSIDTLERAVLRLLAR